MESEKPEGGRPEVAAASEISAGLGKVRLGLSMFATKEDYLKARIEELESALVVVRDELLASNKKDSEAFMQMTIEQIESWGVARHVQTHSFCLDQIRDVLGA